MGNNEKEAKGEGESFDYETAKKFGIDLDNLIAEQKRLSKLVSLKDGMDFSLVERVAGCANSFLGNQIISAIVVCNNNFEVLEQNYATKKLEFPYIAGFRAYRELPAMVECFEKLEEVPDVIFIDGHGIAHPRRLGIASHFGISIQRPTIGIAQRLLVGGIDGDKIILDGKDVGLCFVTKQGSKPIYISPGHRISLNTTLKITRKFLKLPHKLPEPLVIARRYADKIRDELQSKLINTD